MKQILKWSLSLLLIILLFNNISCRKKELKPFNFIDKPFHCYDNVLDSGEKVIDKGGDCGCDTVKIESACGLKTNQIYFDSNYYDITPRYRDTSINGLITMGFSFNNTDMVRITCRGDILLNAGLHLRTTNFDRDKIDISISTTKYGSSQLDNLYGNIKILSNGCVFNLMTCETRFYNFANPSPKPCIMNIDLQLF